MVQLRGYRSTGTVIGVLTALLAAHPQLHAQQEPSATESDDYRYRVLVGLAGTIDTDSCGGANSTGIRNGTTTDVTAGDTIVVKFARASATFAECSFVDPEAAGVANGSDIQIYLTGFGDNGETRVEVKNTLVQEDIDATVQSGFETLRVGLPRLLHYRDGTGQLRRVQHGQVLRLTIRRYARDSEQRTRGLSPDHVFITAFDFKVSRPMMWSGFQFPTIFGLTFNESGENTWRALPVALASGVRIGLRGEFAPYLDALLYAAPALKIAGGGDDGTEERVEPPATAAAGVLLDFGGKIGIGAGADIDFNGPARFMLTFTLASELLPRFVS